MIISILNNSVFSTIKLSFITSSSLKYDREPVKFCKIFKLKTMYESTLSECENITNFNQVQSACYMKIPGFSSSPYYALLQTYCFCPFLNREIVLCRKKKTTNRNSVRI